MKSDRVLESLELLHDGPRHGIGEIARGLVQAEGFAIADTEDRAFETVGKTELYQ